MELLGLLKSSWKLILTALIWLARQAVGRLMRPILLQSHQYHLGLRNWQRRWERLDENLEYKLILASVLTNDPNPESFVHLRNVGAVPLTQVRVSVVATSGKLQFSDTLELPFLDVGAHEIQKLPRIPAQDMWATDNGIRVSYESIHVVLNSYESNGQLKEIRRKTLRADIMYCDFLTEGAWMRFEGKLYNTKAIHEYITHHQHKVYFHLASRRGLFCISPAAQWELIRRSKRLSLVPWLLLYSAASYRPLVSAYCWVKLMWRRPTIKFAPDQSYWWETP